MRDQSLCLFFRADRVIACLQRRRHACVVKHHRSLQTSLRGKRFHLPWFRSKERPVLAAREMKREPKNERGGKGRGRKETLADKPLDFENLRSPANAATDWLG